jgi:16S rRNA (cytosine967-C5)-methyltransferase
MNLRAIAARVIFDVLFRGHSLSTSLPAALEQIPEARDQALVQTICYGVCRRFFYLEELLNLLMETNLKPKDHDIVALLLVGLYQLTDMRIPDYAAVGETVDATKDFQKVWAKGLVNAILRNYQRYAEDLKKEVDKIPSALYSHPEWMIGKIKKNWPDQWQAILTANNAHPPFVLRVNQQRHTREEYLSQLIRENLPAEIIPETQMGIVLAEATHVENLPGFAAGDVSVQDGAAQLAAELLDLAPTQRVLDACAAPGGKTAHIAELQPDLAELVALDRDEKRLISVTENLERLHLTATIIHADAADTEKWWDGKLFDRILLDAPCSASGVIRRHPDIKLLRRPEDIENLVQEQSRLLTALWTLLKIDGVLLYSTCSIFPQENEQLMKRFLTENSDAEEFIIERDIGEKRTVGLQILPGMYGMDGFYYARLRKCANDIA